MVCIIQYVHLTIFLFPLRAFYPLPRSFLIERLLLTRPPVRFILFCYKYILYIFFSIFADQLPPPYHLRFKGMGIGFLSNEDVCCGYECLMGNGGGGVTPLSRRYSVGCALSNDDNDSPPARRQRNARATATATSSTRHNDGAERPSPPSTSRSDGRDVAAVGSGVACGRRRGRALHQPVRRPCGRRGRWPWAASWQGGQETRIPKPRTGQFYVILLTLLISFWVLYELIYYPYITTRYAAVSVTLCRSYDL